jgi:hypothetical protein
LKKDTKLCSTSLGQTRLDLYHEPEEIANEVLNGTGETLETVMKGMPGAETDNLINDSDDKIK